MVNLKKTNIPKGKSYDSLRKLGVLEVATEELRGKTHVDKRLEFLFPYTTYSTIYRVPYFTALIAASDP